MRRVYYSGYISVNTYDKRLPALKQPPLVRENRLYQADWLLRFYQFKVDEIVDDAYPDLDLEIDPKLSWALRHPEQFPVDVNNCLLYTSVLAHKGIAAGNEDVTQLRVFFEIGHETAQFLVPAFFGMQFFKFKVCLLYTSRCV